MMRADGPVLFVIGRSRLVLLPIKEIDDVLISSSHTPKVLFLLSHHGGQTNDAVTAHTKRRDMSAPCMMMM